MKIPGMGPSAKGTETYPGVQGGTNWYAPSFSPRTRWMYLTTWDDYHSTYFTWDQKYEPGKWYVGGGVRAAIPSLRRDQVPKWGADAGHGAVQAINPLTGDKMWAYKMTDVTIHRFGTSTPIR